MVNYGQGFCGGEELWDSDLTWWTYYPRFTKCFESTVLTYVPTALLWFGACVATRRRGGGHAPPTPISFLSISKALVVVVMALCYVGSAVWDIVQGLEVVPWAGLISDLVNCASCLLVLLIQHLDRKAGKTSSGLLWSYFFILAFFHLPRYYRVLLATFSGESDDIVPIGSFVTTVITYPLTVAALLLSCFVDWKSTSVDKQTARPSPVLTAPPFSALVFDWITPFIVKGYRTPITLADLYDPLPELQSTANYNMWLCRWEKELRVANYNPKDGTYDKRRPPRLFFTLLLTFWPTIAMAYFIIFLRCFIRASPALLLDLITSYMTDETQPLWKGILYAFVIFLASTVNSFCYRHADYALSMMGIKIKGILISAIYKKALLISSRSQSRYTVGELVNLVSVDADKILKLCNASAAVVGCPTVIIISIVLLWQYLGPSCLAGVGVILVVMPISSWIAQQSKHIQDRQMKLKDTRLKSMSEIINSIKILKLFAWEPPFTERVEGIREKEVSLLKKFAYVTATIGFFWTCTPFFVGLISFITFVFASKDNVLTPTVAFVSLTLFNLMRSSMVAIPNFISNAVQTSVAFKRVWNFLLCEEIDQRIIGSNPSGKDAITMVNVTASWGGYGSKPVLSDINFHAHKGKLVAIVGSVGSGKSSMLSAILGDLSIQDGKVDTLGSIAYVPQQAWIQNQTIRQNIVFTDGFDQRKYDKVLDTCSLRPDLEILAGGDRTEIGEKGINLSGGQKQRVALARAAYQNKELYLFDDPLSAVDAHVGKAIFTNLIGPRGMLRKKTRVLVTNNLSVLSDVDYIVVLKDGRIVEEGSYQGLMDSKGALSDLLKDFLQKKEETADDDTYESDADDDTKFRRPSRTISSSFSRSQSLATSELDQSKSQLVEKETVEEGSIKFQIYVNYFRHIGCILTSFTLLFYVGYRALDITNGTWLSAWSQDNDTSPANRDYRLGVYAAIGLSQGLCNFLGIALLTKSTMTASTNLHKLILRSVMRAPLSFFDTTPMGRLLNRFGKDLDQLDVQLPTTANLALEMCFQIIGMIVLISMNVPVFIALAVPVLCLFIVLRQIFINTFRQIKRLEAVTRSPLYSHFSETINGLSSIRGYCVGDIFHNDSNDKVDISQNCSFHIIIFNYWMSLRLEFLGNFMIFVMVILVVANRSAIDAGTAGLLISYSLNAIVAFNFFVSYSTEVEATIIAAERLDEYTSVEPEAPWTSINNPSPDWPKDGMIEFVNFSTRYRAGLDLVLRDVSLKVEPLQKVGVVGRTGAGKSSLILTIFRIIEGVKGRIFIDGVDIAKIGLHELRSRLTIIPQESVLFCSTIRFNLDPNNEYTDEQLWTALERAHLKQYFEGQTGLDTVVSEGGGNLSVGQRQLVCLARAVLRKTRILVLDEATAAVDLETDALIQDSIRKVFHDSTILTIAHRLNTIIDSDLIVVMGAGRICEMGAPHELLQNPKSEFFSLAQEAGLSVTSPTIIEESTQPSSTTSETIIATTTETRDSSSRI